MVSFEEALRTILENVGPVGTEQLPLVNAAGMILAEEVVSPWDMPFWDNSAMDGFAVRSTDTGEIPCKLRVTGYIPAGASAEGVTVEPGCAVKIMTGAPVPAGADTIVPIEETEETSGEQVTICATVTKGQHIRHAGEDLKAGDRLLETGAQLRPAEISLMASCGRPTATVFRPPAVAVLSTGDELVEIGTRPGAGQIINSNSLSLAAAVKEAGAIPRLLGIARDNRISHLDKLRQGLQSDCLITSAGASAGDRDLVRAVLEELGVKFLFTKVAMKPGKPTAFGIWEGRPVFCLPGNPVASQITFEMLVRPALMKMLGHRRVIRPTVIASLEQPLKSAGRMQCLRVTLRQQGDRYLAASSGNQETGILRTSILSDTLALLPANTTFNAGDQIRVMLPANQLVER